MFRKCMFLLCLVILACLSIENGLCDSVQTSDLVRYVPTVITINSDDVVVDGYFVNLNEDLSVSNFEDVELEIYFEDALLVRGDFGTINRFTVKEGASVRQKFHFNYRPSRISNGTYVCDGSFYARMSCKFSFRTFSSRSTMPVEPKEVYAVALTKLALNAGPGTKNYYPELGTFNVQGERIRILAKSWDSKNGIWWVKCQVGGTIGWTGLKRFDTNSFDLNDVQIEYL